MKSLNTSFLCCQCKLYRIGISIGFIYMIPNLIVLVHVFGMGVDAFVPFMCALTVLTSVLMIKGLLEENHRLLEPWLINIGALILFNIIALIILFEELNRKDTKELFYLLFGLFIIFELQAVFWYVIFCLFKMGKQKSKILNGPINSISKIVETKKGDHFKVKLFTNDNLVGEKKMVSV